MHQIEFIDMKKTVNNFLMLLVFIVIAACNLQNAQNSKERKIAQQLNDTALSFIQKTGYQKDSMVKAIDLLDSAIKEDSTYKFAYSNKASILCSLGDCKGALKALGKLNTLSPKDPMIYMMQGNIIARMGDELKATQKYKIADSLYDIQIKNRIDVGKNRISKMFCQLFLKRKQDVLNDFEKYKKEISSNDINQFNKLIKDFDKDKFIKDFCNCSNTETSYY